jgi:regulator of sigma E protease
MMTVVTVMGFLSSALAWIGVALLFSLAIFIHEFGHFLAARWMGLQIDAFAIGFGPALWKRRVNGVEYKIGCIPFGGYVALPQLDPSGMEKVQGEQHADPSGERQLPDIAAWKRIVVAVAGPLGNVVLAVFLAYLIFFTPGVKTGVVDTRVGTVLEESDAWKAGMRSGDRIVAVNGKKVGTWTDLMVESQLMGSSGRATFQVARAGSTLEMEIPFETDRVSGIRVLADVLPETRCVVVGVRPDSSAAACGLVTNDVIQTVSGRPVMGMTQFVSLITKSGANPVVLGVIRGTKRLTLTATPHYDESLGRHLIGVTVTDGLENVRAWMMYRDPWQQLKWDSLSVVRVLQALVMPMQKGERGAVAKNVGGPVAIVIGLYHTLRVGLMDGLGFLRMICVNLAILNLLPLPVLDGGHIMFALFEMITRRKPHPKVVAVLVNACAVLLIGLMALLVYRDIAKQWHSRRALRDMAREEALAVERTSSAVTNAPAQP